MLFNRTLLGIFVQLAALTAVNADCDNNCGRAVAGTASFKLPLASRSADCSSYMLVYTTTTVTPPVSTIYFGTTQTSFATTVTVVSTITETATTTSSITTGVPPQKRDMVLAPRTAGTIPTYASACSSSAAYVSACSCLGVPVAPTSTITTTLDAVTTSVTTTLTDFEATTTVTTATALTTTTVIVDVPAYAQVAGPYDGCGILHYDDWTPNESLNDKSNVQAGTDFCIQQCNMRPSCTTFYQQWQYGSYWACWLADNYVFSSADLECGIPSDPYGLAYVFENSRL